MADYVITAYSNPQHYQSGASTPVIKYYQESTCVSSAVIKLGDIVSFDTVTSSNAHRLVRAPFNGGNGGNLLNTTNVVGTAVEASTSDGSTNGLGNPRVRMIGVAVAEPNAEFIAPLYGNGAADSTQIGKMLAVRYDSTNHTYGVDSTNSTAALASVVVTGIPEPTIGDTNGLVIFKFLSTGVSPAVRAL